MINPWKIMIKPWNLWNNHPKFGDYHDYNMIISYCSTIKKHGDGSEYHMYSPL
jgi:hypothetical protein